jgi:hypothetical protein
LFNIGTLVNLGSALLKGDGNAIERMITNKIESMGQSFLEGFVSNITKPAFGLGGRVEAAIRTGGGSEIKKQREEFIHSMSLPTSAPAGVRKAVGTVNRFEQAFYRNAHLINRPEGKHQIWSKSRQEWLDQSWKHDWRTQPRDVEGQWKVGRLRHPYVAKGARRIRRKRRATARKIVRQAWGR